MQREFADIMEAYETKVLHEGLIWDGIRWAAKKLYSRRKAKRLSAVGANDTMMDAPNAEKKKNAAKPSPPKPSAENKPIASANPSKCSVSELPEDATPIEYRYWVRQFDTPENYKEFVRMCEGRKSSWKLLNYNAEPMAIAAIGENGKRIAAVFPISKYADEGKLAACRKSLEKSMI